MNQKIKDNVWLFRVSLMVLSLFFFLAVGKAGYIEMDDSGSYQLPNLIEGIMPVYPLFLNLLRLMFGNYFLTAAACVQGMIASICVTVFVCCLVERFHTAKWEGYLLWIACLLPFSIELPDYVVTHVIYTESISYSFYYLFTLCLLNAVFSRRIKWLLATLGMAVFMGLLRPQLLLLLVLWGAVCLYVFLSRTEGEKGRRAKALMKGCATGITGILVGVVLIYGLRGAYVQGPGKWFESLYPPVDFEKLEEEGASTEQGTFAQFGSALVSRGFFEADEEDVKYYETEEMKEIFRRVFEACDEKEYRYVYARKGLWMWSDLTKPHIYDEASREITEYLAEQGMPLNSPEIGKRVTQIELRLAFTEIFVHFGRFIYHCFRLMVPGFISCVFFNIRRIYLLCHLITLFLYASGMGMAAYVFRRCGRAHESGLFMLWVIGGCIIFVGITNLMFFGMQRYFLYQMGIFYCAYYLVFRTAVKAFIGNRKEKL